MRLENLTGQTRRFMVVMSVSITTGLSGCMTLDQDREAQRPSLPNTDSVAWASDNRLYGSVTVDYVTGMSQHSYLFGKANQSAFRPLLERTLNVTRLAANTPLAARYGLQVEFRKLEGSYFGTDFQSSSVASYRIVDRSSGTTVFEKEIPANFSSVYPGLNEEDAAQAYLLSTRAEGEAADQSWESLYYASVFSVISGPLVVGLHFINPDNYIAWNDFWGAPPNHAVLGARRGALSEKGIGTRNGAERQAQADYMMMSQSLTKFIIALGNSENVRFLARIPCVNNSEVSKIAHDLTMHGISWQTDNCIAYKSDGYHQPNSEGIGFTNDH